MSEIGDDFKYLRELGRAKKQSNREDSTATLKREGYTFRSSNGGVHLVVTHGDAVFDFWPSTGKWIRRNTARIPGGHADFPVSVSSGRGVFNLIRELRKCKSPS